MFVRVKKRQNKDGTIREYLQIVENKRIDGKIRQKVLCTLGRLDELKDGQLDRLIESLAKFSESQAVLQEARDLFAEWSKEYGPVLVFRRVWEKVGLAGILKRLCSESRVEFNVVEAVFAMVLNRLSAPQSKLKVSEWAREDVYEPGFSDLQLHHYYRALDFLAQRKEILEEQLFFQGRDLFNQSVDLVFFDTTTSYFEGEGAKEFCQYGYSRDHRPDRVQVVIGLLMRQDGIPIAHEVLPGNTSDIEAFLAIIKRCQHRFNIRRVVIVADRGMVSEKTLKAVESAGYEYIVGVRMRRSKEVREIVLGCHGRYQKVSENLEVKNVEHNGKRYVICFNPQEAERDALVRQQVLASLEHKLKSGGLKGLIGNSAYRRFLAVSNGAAQIDRELIKQEARFDGKYVLRTNTTLPAEQVAMAYKQLWMVERAFREMKCTLKLRPMYHWTESRIRGHIMVCFLAFYLEMALRQMLSKCAPDVDYARVITDLNRVKAVKLSMNGKEFVVRTELRGEAHLAFKAVGTRPPQRVLQL